MLTVTNMAAMWRLDVIPENLTQKESVRFISENYAPRRTIKQSSTHSLKHLTEIILRKIWPELIWRRTEVSISRFWLLSSSTVVLNLSVHRYRTQQKRSIVNTFTTHIPSTQSLIFSRIVTLSQHLLLFTISNGKQKYTTRSDSLVAATGLSVCKKSMTRGVKNCY